LCKANSFDYDTWFDYIRLEEAEGADVDKTRDIFERAIANVPPVAEKRSVWSPLVVASTCAAPLRGAPLSLALSLT